KNLTREQADEMRGKDPDYAQRDLFDAIAKGDFPKWRVCVQIMPEKAAETYSINPFDLTKVWPHGDCPLVQVAELVLDRNPVNYEPNSFNGPTQEPAFRERPRTVSGAVDRHNHRLDSDYYTQPGNLFRLMKPDARERLIGNIVASMKSVPRRIQELQVQHFYKADPAYGTGVAKGLGLNIEAIVARAKEAAAD